MYSKFSPVSVIFIGSVIAIRVITFFLDINGINGFSVFLKHRGDSRGNKEGKFSAALVAGKASR